MKLWDIAHSRTGDKGNISNVSLIAYDGKDYEMLKEKVTAERVKEHFKGIVKGEVVRYELPNIHALNFVMYAALGGGVTRSLSVDMHGKGLSSYLLDLDSGINPEPRGGFDRWSKPERTLMRPPLRPAARYGTKRSAGRPHSLR